MQEVKRSFSNGEEYVEVDMKPKDILHDPILNKGTAFTREERKELGLEGLLPYHTSTIEDQVKRRYANFVAQHDSIAKHKFLTSLQDRNEVLFYRLLSEHPEEMMPYIYTPTVGDASLHYSSLYNQNRGVYISYPDKDNLDAIIDQIPKDQVDVIVVTDGGRILGLGDLGVGGMPIPVGKLSLYTLFGGIHPDRTLPIQLDIGTDNPDLLNDPLYLGWRHERVKGSEYFEFIDAFIHAIKKKFPKVLIQWEDFSKAIAQPLLEKYRQTICSFNDDIQGTAGVVVAGILSALRGTNQDIKDQRMVLFGAGSAGIGVAQLITQAMVKAGMSPDEAKKRIYILGRNGLAHTESKWLDEKKRPFAQSASDLADWEVNDLQNISLFEVVKHARPTILIGTSTMPGSFTKELVQEMRKHVKRPIIFPLSNPTSKTEAVPADLLKWTDGQALIATGSPFAPVEHGDHMFTIGQCNNVLIFPGVGLGVIASRATQVTNGMFLRAAEVLSEYAPIVKDPYESLFPGFDHLRKISAHIAFEVGQYAIKEGISANPPSDLKKVIEEAMWEPKYAHFRKPKK